MAAKQLTILLYHRVLAHADALQPGDVDARTFDGHVRVLTRFFNVLPLSQAVRRLRDDTLPARAVSVTFDDGYADNHDVALPILLRRRACATFFVATGFLDGGRMWNDTIIESVRRASGPKLNLDRFGFGEFPIESESERGVAASALIDKLKYLPVEERQAKADALAKLTGVETTSDLMMTSFQLRALAQAGMEIGAHTVSHPILARTDDETARREIGEGKRRLEEILGKSVTLFAFPNGRPGRDYDERHVTMVREAGFDASFSTARANACAQSSVYELPRFSPWDKKPYRFALRVAQSRLRDAVGRRLEPQGRRQGTMAS